MRQHTMKYWHIMKKMGTLHKYMMHYKKKLVPETCKLVPETTNKNHCYFRPLTMLKEMQWRNIPVHREEENLPNIYFSACSQLGQLETYQKWHVAFLMTEMYLWWVRISITTMIFHTWDDQSSHHHSKWNSHKEIVRKHRMSHHFWIKKWRVHN